MSDTTDPALMSAETLLGLYARRDLSPVEVLRAVTERIARFNPWVNAFAVMNPRALHAAGESEARWMAGRPMGMLDGVPATVKDLLHHAGFPTRRGSRTTDTTPLAEDAPSVMGLKEAGAVIIGKTTTTEFGWKSPGDCPLHGITRNPWNPQRTPGGSSSGAGAAGAACFGPLHIGTDAGGSIRIPAAYCGLVGVKPSFGRIPQWPLGAFGHVAVAGPMTRTVRDAALMFSAMARFDLRDPYALPDDLYAFADVLGRHGAGVFESASRIGEGERDDPDVPKTRAEVAWMGEVSRRSGRPVSFGLTQHDSRPDLFQRVIGFAKDQNALGGTVRPQTTARSVGILFSIDTRTPFDRCESWKSLRVMRNGKKMVAIRDAAFRSQLIDEAEQTPPGMDLDQLFIVNLGTEARYDLDPSSSLAAEARRRGISPAAAYIELLLETDGRVVCSFPFLNQRLDAVEEMLDDPLVTLGLADAGAHVGQILDASQPTFFLSYWIRERGRWTIEEAIRRLTSDTADLFGIDDRGRLQVGAFADVNVIDFDALRLPAPAYTFDFPNGAGRYVQGAEGYDCTIVNGRMFMEHGQHTGEFAGRLLKNSAAS